MHIRDFVSVLDRILQMLFSKSSEFANLAHFMFRQVIVLKIPIWIFSARQLDIVIHNINPAGLLFDHLKLLLGIQVKTPIKLTRSFWLVSLSFLFVDY